ncbi:MAG: TIGR04086 family membrane protein [Clostridia bacterium]|nr:TIGR04086 family membrane protein [Clostridia bacterium]
MQSKTFLTSVIKATALSLISSLVGILLFALIVKLVALSDGTVKTVNQFIKVIAVFIGCFFSVKGKLGIVKGGVSGALCTVLLYAVFALMSGSGIFSVQTLADMLFTAVVGGIAGIIAVNLRGKE